VLVVVAFAADPQAIDMKRLESGGPDGALEQGQDSEQSEEIKTQVNPIYS
jgi:hypothetical protein